jgi:Ice-binding-like
MSDPTRRRRTTSAVALAAGLTLVVLPLAAQAAPVNLSTTAPFVVLAGSTVTNTGPSVLNGDLGVAPGTALVGFGLPAVVHGATHSADAVANQAQTDLVTAYDVAAGQPVPPANDLTGTDLGNRALTAGAYRFTSSAQLTGRLTLNAQGDTNAQFVFEIASSLTTASASSVVLTNGANPCNVHWQVGSSATLGTTTAFQGNLMALSSISLSNGATVIGRMLARNGQVSLINNVLTRPQCAATTTTPGGSTRAGGGSGSTGGGSVGSGTPAAGNGQQPLIAGRNGTATISRTASTTLRDTPTGERGSVVQCTRGFTARVRGHLIAGVVFRLDGRRLASRRAAPYRVTVHAAASSGAHRLTARITFVDRTRAVARTLRYRACAAALLQPRQGPSQFTG